MCKNNDPVIIETGRNYFRIISRARMRLSLIFNSFKESIPLTFPRLGEVVDRLSSLFRRPINRGGKAIHIVLKTMYRDAEVAYLAQNSRL